MKKRYEIWQIKRKSNAGYRFFRFNGKEFSKDHYEKIYESEICTTNESMRYHESILDRLFYIFNMEHPVDFRGHSLSVSDIVILKEDEKDNNPGVFYIEPIGFKDVTDIWNK